MPERTPWAVSLGDLAFSTLEADLGAYASDTSPVVAPPLCVNTTPQMTRFRDGKVCNNWLQMKLTITEYSLTAST